MRWKSYELCVDLPGQREEGAKNIFTYLEMIDNNKDLNSLNNGGYD